jgi:hypothetical protein
MGVRWVGLQQYEQQDTRQQLSLAPTKQAPMQQVC